MEFKPIKQVFGQRGKPEDLEKTLFDLKISFKIIWKKHFKNILSSRLDVVSVSHSLKQP